MQILPDTKPISMIGESLAQNITDDECTRRKPICDITNVQNEI